MPLLKLTQIIDLLESYYGAPAPPFSNDPWLLVLWENVAYLADDERRAAAMRVLQTRVGTDPERIQAAPHDRLMEVTRHGIVAEQFAEKLRRCAKIVLEEFDGDLKAVLKGSVAQAKKGFKKFPGIGDPGADKILLFTGKHPNLALDSNGLRVLVRLGFGEEQKNYAAMYRGVQEAVQGEIVSKLPWLVKAHQLLRRHGQELCRRSKPACQQCPLVKICPYYLTTPSASR
jgi:endonuclease III